MRIYAKWWAADANDFCLMCSQTRHLIRQRIPLTGFTLLMPWRELGGGGGGTGVLCRHNYWHNLVVENVELNLASFRRLEHNCMIESQL